MDGAFFNYPFMLRDSFLDPVRNDRAFHRILAQARKKHEDFKERFFPTSAPSENPGPVDGREQEAHRVRLADVATILATSHVNNR